VALMLALVPAAPAQAKKPLVATTFHVLDTTNTVVNGYMLGWVGEIDIDGDEVPDADIVWWLELENWVTTGQASHYPSIGEIWDSYPDGQVLLATEGRGTTTMTNTTWRANSVVTYARPGSVFDGWQGRNVHESGQFDVTEFPWTGTSIFRLN